MAKRRHLISLSLLLMLAISQQLHAEETTARKLEKEKSDKYLSILLKKPRKGYIFDSYYNSFLRHSSPEEFEAYLFQNYKKTNNPVYLKLLAFFFEKENRDKAALETYEQLLKLRPDSPDVLYQKGLLEFYGRDYRFAIEDLLKAKELKPDPELRTNICKLLGKAYTRNQQTEKGLAEWRALRNSQPDNTELIEALMELELREGVYKEALELCQFLIAKTKKPFKKMMLQLRLAEIYELQNQRNKALEVYERLLTQIGADSWIETEILSRVDKIFIQSADRKGLRDWYETQAARHPTRIKLLKKYALLLAENGDIDGAIKAYHEVLKISPLNMPNRIQFAEFLQKNGKYSDALRIINELIQKHPDESDLYFTKASLEIRKKNTGEVIKSLNNYIATSGKAEISYIKAAHFLTANGHPQLAGDIYDDFVKAYPDSTDAAEQRAIHLYLNGNKPKAIKAFEAIGASRELDGLIRLCRVLLNLKEPKTALAVLEKRKKDFAGNYAFNQELYATYCALKEYQKAEMTAEKQLQVAEGHFQVDKACINIIYVLGRTGHTSKKLGQLQKQQNLGDNDLCLLVDLLLYNGESQQALKLIDDRLKMEENSILLYEHKLKIHRRNYDYDAAIATLKKMMALQPRKNAYYTRELATICHKAGKDKDALEWIRKWKVLSPGSTIPYILESRIYESAGNLEKAIKTIRKAIRLFPENRELRFLLANYFIINEDHDAAVDVYWKLMMQIQALNEKVNCVKQLLKSLKSRSEKMKLLDKFRKIVEISPNQVFPLLAAAETCKDLGMRKEYRDYLLKASKNRKNDAHLLREIAKLAEEEGDYDNALNILQKAEKLDTSGQISRDIALFYLRHNEEEKGFQKLVERISDTQNAAETLKQTAISLLESGRYDLALDILRSHIAKFTDNYELAFLYAVALEANRKRDKAINQFLNVLDIVNNRPEPINKEFKKWHTSVLRYIYVLNLYDEAKEILLVHHLLYRNGLYNNNFLDCASRMSMLMGRPATTMSFPMPESPDEVSVYVTAHLARLVNELGDEKMAKKVETELTRRNVQYAEIKLDLPLFRRKAAHFWEQLAKKHPKDDIISAIWCCYLLEGTSDYQAVKEAYYRVRDKKARLAVNVVVNSIDKFPPPIDESIIYDMVKLYDTLEERNPSVFIYRLCNFLMRNPRISDKLRKHLIDTSLRLHREEVKHQKAFEQYYLYLFFMLLKEKQYGAFVDTLKEEFKKQNGNLSSGFGRHSLFNVSILLNSHMLRFPPSHLPDFPDSILTFFNSVNSPHSFVNRLRLNNVDFNALWREAVRVENPGLKLLLADLCGKTAETEKIIDSMLKSDVKNPSLPILAAFYSASRSLNMTTLKLFNQALKHTNNRAIRKDILCCIVIYAERLMQATKNKEGKPVFIDAARRLTKMRLTTSEKHVLASALAKAGYADDAKQLLATIPKPPPRPRVMPVSPIQKIENAFRAGKQQEALTDSLRLFRKEANAQLALPFQNSYQYQNSSDLVRLMSVLRRHKAEAPFMEELKPGSGQMSTARTLEYALACQMLGNVAEAVKQYNLVLAENPDNRSANFKLALIYAGNNQDKAASHMAKVYGANIDAFGRFLSMNMHAFPQLSHKLAMLEILTRLMKKNHWQTGSTEESRWLTTLIFQLENSANDRGHVIPYLFEFEKQNLKDPVQKKRLETYTALCNIAMRNEEIAPDIFPSFLMVTERNGTVDDTLYQKAKEIIKADSDNNDNDQRNTVYVRNRRVYLKSPLQFLIEYATNHHKTNDLQTFFKTLKSNQKKPYGKIIHLTGELMEADNKEFLKTAREILAVKTSSNYDLSCADLDMKFSIILTVLADKKSKTPITAIVFQELSTMLKERPFYLSRANFPYLYADYLARNGTTEEISNYLKGLIALLVPNAKARLNPNTSYYYVVNNVFSSLLSLKPGLIFTILEVLRQTVATQFRTVFLQRNLQALVHMYIVPSAASREFLDSSPWTKNLPDFRFVMLDRQPPFLKIFLKTLLHNRPMQMKVSAALQGVAPQTFGSQFLRILILSPTQNNDKLFEFLGSHLAELQKMEKNSQQNFFSGLKAICPPPVGEPTNPETKEFIKYYNNMLEK